MMNNKAISIKNLSKTYKLYDRHIDRLKEALHPLKKKYHRQFYALNNLNLEIGKGEVLGIVGRNGAGKSTLLKIITGILSPSQGQISVNGNISALLELGTGFNPELTGIENIYLNGTIKGFTKKEMNAKMDNIISFAEIGDFVKQPLKTYSSGMSARLGFALAINMEPEILVLDEVLAVGDELFKRKCYAKMEEFFKSGCTILFVSHSVGTINEICSRAILLDNGEQILEGSPKFVNTYYQKMLFAPPEETQKIREEIIRLNRKEDKKKLFQVEEKKNSTENNELDPAEDDPEQFEQEPMFIAGFKSKSLVEQKNYDVEIMDIKILTLEDKEVNALVMDEEYIYSYTVKFNIEAENIVFTMAVKNEKGLVVSSARTGIGEKGHGRIVNYAKKGDQFLIDWNFNCNLLPGNYYTNIGIKSFPLGKEPIILNRIVDALVFKVQDSPYLLHGGLCHLNQTFEITQFKFK